MKTSIKKLNLNVTRFWAVLPTQLLIVSVAFFGVGLRARVLDAPTLVFEEVRSSFTNVLASGGLKNGNVNEQESVDNYLRRNAKFLSPAKRHSLAKIVLAESAKRNLPAGLVLSVIRVESGFRNSAVSHVGAIGLMQLMPDTAQWLATRLGMNYEGPQALLDESVNIKLGTYYLGYLLKKYNGDLHKMLNAYNRGPGKVDSDVDQGRPLSTEYAVKVRKGFPRVALAHY